MANRDLFGLQREQRINKSGVRNIFTPHQPVHSINLFFGRESLVKKLIEQINTPGQHALLYGDRGVGKSSLANVTAELLLKDLIKGKLYPKRCDSQDTFETVLAQPLKDVGIDLRIAGETSSRPVFRSQWPTLGKQFDSAFLDFMNELMASTEPSGAGQQDAPADARTSRG